MENGDLLSAATEAFAHYGVLILLAILVLGGVAAALLYRQQNNSQRDLQRELQGLRFELDEQRMQPGLRRPGAPARAPSPAGARSEPGSLASNETRPGGNSHQLPSQTPPAARAQHRIHAELELQAYQKIWSSLRELHDKLGSFLRAIETGESVADTRLAARTAALKAKDCAQKLRPFYPENIEAMVFQLIDNEVHMHLSACSYLDGNDGRPKQASPDITDTAYRSLRDESKLIYDGECRQQLNTLVQAIRQRLASQTVID